MQELDFVLADTYKLRKEAYSVRYQIYCVENEFEPLNSEELETDQYDDHSIHALLRYSDIIIGHVRMVMNTPFPVQEMCVYKILDLPGMAEGSRICISKARIKKSCAKGNFLVVLVKAMIEISYNNGVRYWCGFMEPRFLRRLASLGIHFTPLGAPIWHHGAFRQAGYKKLDVLLDRAFKERPDIWIGGR